MYNESSISTPKARVNSLLKNVYLWMTAGLVMTGVVAYIVGHDYSLLSRIYSSGSMFLIVIAQFALVFLISGRLDRISTGGAIAAFAGYSALNGLMLSSLFAVYASVDISTTFFICALMFGAMSIFAMVSKKDLSGWGRFLTMALWGLVISMLVEMIFNLDALYFLVGIAGTIIFSALTAYDTRKIMQLNESYGYNIDENTFIKLSIIGALELYLDFINLFLYLLRFVSVGRNNK